MNVGPPPKPNLFCYELIIINSNIFGIMKTYSFLYLKILKMGVLKIKFEILEILIWIIIWKWDFLKNKFFKDEF